MAAGEAKGGESKGEGAEPRYNHHRLDAYQATLEFIRWRRAALRRLPRGSLANQLDRAAASVALNIGEACGESSRTAQEHFFRMARRSATECDAALDVIEAMQLATPQQLAPGRLLIHRTTAMLTRLARIPRRA